MSQSAWAPKVSVLAAIGFFGLLLSCDPGNSVDPLQGSLGTVPRDTTTTPSNPTARDTIPAILAISVPEAVMTGDTTTLTLSVVDSLLPAVELENVYVTLSSQNFVILDDLTATPISIDSTNSVGEVTFRITSSVPGSSNLAVKAVMANNIQRSRTFNIGVNNQPVTDSRERSIVFRADRSNIKADGSDSTLLRVTVKDDNHNPIVGEAVRFTANGGLVTASDTTDAKGQATAILTSERINKNVIVTASLPDRALVAQQAVTFSGVSLTINPYRRVLLQNQVNAIVFELRDANNVPISGDSIQIRVRNASGGFAGTGMDSMLVTTDTRGQYRTTVTASNKTSVIIDANGLGVTVSDTILFTNDQLTVTAAQKTLEGNGTSSTTLTARLVNSSNQPVVGASLKWTTTFGNFTTTPFTTTDANGRATITLQAPKGTGLAVVSVEAKTGGNLLASGNDTVRVASRRVARLELKVSPDNIPVKVGEAKLTAKAYDIDDNVMEGVLIGFRLIKGAGAGGETIDPSVVYTQNGVAEATLNAGGVISYYQSVKLAAVALEVYNNPDTSIVVASSDTVGLTISGPPHRVSIGQNILKGENPNDGTFALPVAAVVTDVNGNHVADGTPVHFGTIPVGMYVRTAKSYRMIQDFPYYVIIDSLRVFYPFSDYNNNRKLDSGEVASLYNTSNPARGEDRDGNGFINVGEYFYDANGNGVRDETWWTTEPTFTVETNDSLQPTKTVFVDYNGNGLHDSSEYFEDSNGDGICQCPRSLSDRNVPGATDANGNWYELNFYGSPLNRPFPSEVSVGIDRMVETENGKAITKIVYVQSHATRVRVRVSAEANGVRSTSEVDLPIVADN